MQENFILLPADQPDEARLFRIPPDWSEKDAYRRVTSIIAEIEQKTGPSTHSQLLDMLADQGFHEVNLIIGPHIP